MIYSLYNPSVFCFAKSTSLYTREAEEVLTEGEKRQKFCKNAGFLSLSSFHSTAPSSEGAVFDKNESKSITYNDNMPNKKPFNLCKT